MLPIQQLQELIQGKKVAFIGAGVSHKRCIEQFVELGAQVTLCDQKKSLEDFGAYADTLRRLHVRLSLGEHYTDGFAGQDIIMRTPGYEYYKPELQAALQAGTKVTSEVELFFELCPCEIVAVTGSDGKTTTTTLISKMFEAAGRKVFLGGNIGAALLPQLADVTPEAVAVVELSSFQLISMRVSPKVAVVTNVTPNHLDHHKDMQEYIDAKRNILIHQVPPCREVLGYENEITRGMQADCKGKQVWFTRLHETDNGAFLRDDGMVKVSRSIKENAVKSMRAAGQLRDTLGCEPTVEQIAAACELSVEDITLSMSASMEVESIYKTIYQGDGSEVMLMDKLEDKADIGETASSKVALAQLMETLSQREKELIRMRYYDDYTQMQVAKEFGISQVQVSRMEKKILSGMRKRLFA